MKQKLKRSTKQNIIVRNINKIGRKKAEQKIPLGLKMSSNPKETMYLVFLMPVQRIKSYAKKIQADEQFCLLKLKNCICKRDSKGWRVERNATFIKGSFETVM